MKRATLFGKKMRCAALMMGIAFLLAGCGSSGVEPFVPTSDPTFKTFLTISGTAATGMAIAGANINAKCRVGTGVTTTGVDGRYTLTVPDGQLPCMLELEKQADGIRLHSVVTGSGDSATANITSLTEMLTARLFLSNDLVVFFQNFDAAQATAAITAAAVAVAQADVSTVLTGIVDLGFLTNQGETAFILWPLTAATPDTPAGGDEQDRMLDTLGAIFSAGRLADVVAALALDAEATAIQPAVADLAGPLANAGPEQNVEIGTVNLNGTTSSAFAGRTVSSYAWVLTLKPVDSTAELTSPDTALPTFTADIEGVYVASLTVNDGTWNSTAVTVTVTAGPSGTTPPPPTSPVFKDNLDGTVTDQDTGLMWMRCSIGQTWDGSAGACLGTASARTWDDAIALPAAEILAGHTDWRLPNIRELQTILDRTKFNPAIDTVAFPDFLPSTFWSATTNVVILNTAWYINFATGDVQSMSNDAFELNYVHLVRGAAVPALPDVNRPQSDFIDNADGTVSHTPSGLMLKLCLEGEIWDTTTSICTGNAASRFSWEQATALTAPGFAGKNDWRVPTAKEMASLFGYSTAIITAVFHPFYVDFFWTTTPYAGDLSNAWSVGDVGSGEARHQTIFDTFAVRLVRTQ